MSATASRKGTKVTYWFVDLDCIGRECWSPGEFQHRGATMSGSRNTGKSTPCCMRNAYRGCPHPLPAPSKEIATARRKEGWKIR